MEHKSPTLTVDAIIEIKDKIVLIKRDIEPFKGKLALPGGHVEYGETVESAAKRETKEETRLNIELTDILGVYSAPKRDTRGHYVSTVFIAKRKSGKLKGADDAKEANIYDPNKISEHEMAFDHFKIIEDYLKYKKHKGTYWSTRR